MLILASRSPRRRELLKYITPDFEVVPSRFDERSITLTEPFELVSTLAKKKASTILCNSEDIVIGCDTVVYINDEILGIPQDRDEAFSMLTKLSGETHSVITGVCLRHGDDLMQFECETKVTFFELSEEEILDYINTDEPYDKAGGYGIQGIAGIFINKIEGDYSNVVGLPISRLYKALKEIRN